MAAASTKQGTGPHTAGGPAVTPASTTAVTQGEGTETGIAAGDEEQEDIDGAQRPPGRPTGAARTATGARGLLDATATPEGGAATSKGAPGDAWGAASAHRTSTTSLTESSSTGSGGNSSSRKMFRGTTVGTEHPAV
ncbi:uncharacterized protein [Procambarus clarkii]|uniref:uncharacterized protein n=1 Tax=Procambarus clarkii TaxID=6728 RepID=UPI003743D404